MDKWERAYREAAIQVIGLLIAGCIAAIVLPRYL